MSEIAELLAEFRGLRELFAPRSSFSVVIQTGTVTAGGTGADNTGGASVATVTSKTYVTILKWLPRDPGGILKQIFLSGNNNALYRIVVDNIVVVDELAVESSGAASQSDFVLDFKRKRLHPDRKSGVAILARTTGGAQAALTAIIHGEQVLEW